MKVAIVGAGIAGLATAWALSRRGHDVLVFDRGPIPNPDAASVDEHRLIRALYPDRPGYARMAEDAHAAWDALWADLGRSHYVETGGIGLSRRPGDWTDRAAAALDAIGMGWERLTPAEIADAWPFFDTTGVAWGLLSRRAGVLLADRIVGDLAARLRAGGVALHGHAPVVAIDPGRGAIRTAAGIEVAADAVVVAAGAWTPDLLPDTAGRLRPHRVLCIYVEPPEAHAEAWTRAPALVDAGLPDDHWSVPPVAGTRLKLSAAGHTRQGDPDDDRTVAAAEAESMRARYRGVLRAVDDYRILDARICYYTYAPEERFVVERRGRAWMVSACSGHGFKFGALVGLRMADAVTGTLSPDRVARWAAAVDLRDVAMEE